MRYGFAIGGGSGGSAIGAVSAVVKSKGDAVEIAAAADVVDAVVVDVVVVDVVVVVVVVGAIVVVVSRVVVDVIVVVSRAVVVVVAVGVDADAGAAVAGSCCDWVIITDRGMMSKYSRR